MRLKIAALALAMLLALSGVAAVPIDTLPRHAATHFNFVVVVVSDVARGLDFYTKVLGMHERGRAQPDMKHYEVIVGFDDNPLSTGISVKYRDGKTEPRGNGSSAINLVVKDLSAIVGKVTAHGGKIVLPLVRQDGAALAYSFAIVSDPDGNLIELVEYHKGAP